MHHSGREPSIYNKEKRKEKFFVFPVICFSFKDLNKWFWTNLCMVFRKSLVNRLGLYKQKEVTRQTLHRLFSDTLFCFKLSRMTILVRVHVLIMSLSSSCLVRIRMHALSCRHTPSNCLEFCESVEETLRSRMCDSLRLGCVGSNVMV